MSDFKYCECGNEIIIIESSCINKKYYYCKYCKTLFYPKLEKIEDEFFEGFNTDRKKAMINLALFLDAKNNITKKDLIKLGYLKE